MNAKTDARVDENIAQSAPFARPILKHLRQLIHAECPGVEEAIKWGRPSFLLNGRVFFGMGAFKAHCRAGFWHPEVSALIRAELNTVDEPGGQFGRITSLQDLPDDETMRRYLAEAVRLSAEGKTPRPKPANAPRKPELAVPADLAALLKQHPAARVAFEGFSPSHRREYVEWITEAKREETRTKRLATAIEWLTQGKPRNWKYQNC